MKQAIIGRKVGMTQVFDEIGNVIPVTVIEAGPCKVVQKKTVEKDGYEALQLGFMEIPERKVNKAVKGHFDKAGVSYRRHLKEFKLDNASEIEVGAEIKADTFAAGDKIDVTGTTKGRGFAGGIKRWGLHRLRMTHGTGPVHRQVGSMGACSTPSRVMKNKRLPGHMGVEQVTVQNLNVVKVDAEKNIILVKGAVPGPKGGILTIKDSIKA